MMKEICHLQGFRNKAWKEAQKRYGEHVTGKASIKAAFYVEKNPKCVSFHILVFYDFLLLPASPPTSAQPLMHSSRLKEKCMQ